MSKPSRPAASKGTDTAARPTTPGPDSSGSGLSSDKPREPNALQRREIAKMLLIQTPKLDIIESIENRFKIDATTAARWVDYVFNLFDPTSTDAARKELMRQSFGTVLAGCLAADEYATAVSVLDKLCKLDGLYEPAQIETDTTVSLPPEESDPEKIRERMKSLLADKPELLERLRAKAS